MRFENSIYLWMLSIIPIFTLLMVWAELHRRKLLRKLGDAHLVRHLIPDASAQRRWIKFAITQAVVAVLVLMIARPQMGTKVSHEKRNGIEAIIALDISNSMLAEDVTPSRLQKSKMLIENLVDNFTKDKVGMIVFAGDAFVQLPITSDYVSAKMFLQNIDPSLIPTQGTDIAQAINLAANSFTKQKNIGKAIIVITDGEDHEGGAMEAAKAAKEKGFKVFILGIGNTTGAPIPVVGGGYMQDNTGNTVMTALNEQMCRDIAAAGSGTYIHVDNTSAAQEMLNNEISKMQKGEMESVVYSEYNEQFQVFGIIALILIIIEVCISEAVNPFFKRIRIFRRHIAVIALMLGVGAISASAQSDRRFIRSGNRDMCGGAEDAPTKAEIKYRKALSANSANPQALYNLGCALMAQKKDSAAIDMFGKAANIETSKERRAMCYHNAGVILQGQRQYGAAIEQYKKALRLKPHDNETRYNLVLCQRQQKNSPDNNKNNSNNNSNNNKNNKNSKNNQNDKNNKNNQEKQPQQQEGQMSKENAERLLEAAMQNEKATQQRMKKAAGRSQKRNLQKNW
ncbi:MAG: VWA domain-containing protein [Prevotellaceae bacterium]|nr:VWA domain-containing protein [Prevotellaceae bacterium]